MDHPGWFFMWKTDMPYITTICGWSKKEVIQEAKEQNCQTWKQIYACGGRAAKIKISICKNEGKKSKNGK